MLKNYQSFFSIRITSLCAFFRFIIFLRLSHPTSVIITTFIKLSSSTPSYFSSQLRIFLFLNSTFHRHLAPLQTNFTDIRTVLFFSFRFCLVSVIIIFFKVFLRQTFFIFPYGLFLDVFMFFIFSYI